MTPLKYIDITRLSSSKMKIILLRCCLNFVTVIRASVPKLDLDSTFEQKDDIARAVESELEKVVYALDR